jgi:DNA-binding IclR family transcriptional regulator
MMQEANVGRPAGGVKAADSTLSILEAVALAREPIGLTQIARQLALSKAGVFRYLRTLVERG